MDIYIHIRFVLGAQDVKMAFRKEQVHNLFRYWILDVIEPWSKYDPTLEETSDELLRTFLDENRVDFQNYYEQVEMWQRKRKEMFIKTIVGSLGMQKDM